MQGRQVGFSRFHGILLITLFLFLRLPILTADPPARIITYYQDAAFSVFDEGWWCANAREKVLFGETRGTGFDLFWVSPVFTAVETVAFRIAGVSLASARLTSVFFGAAGIFLLLMVGRLGTHGVNGPRCAGLAALLWTVLFAGAHYGRLALPETTGTVLGLAGTLALLHGSRGGRLGAGALSALAMLTKPHFAFLIPTFLVAGWVLAIRHDRHRFASVGWIIAGAAIPLGGWGTYFALHAREALDLVSFYAPERWFAGRPPDVSAGIGLIKPVVQTLTSGVIYRHPLLVHLPIVFLSAAAAAPAVGRGILHPRRAEEVPDAGIVLGLWALIGGGLISILPFQPLRYYVPLFPALAYLASWLFTGGTSTAKDGAAEPGTAKRRLASWVLSVVRWVLGALVVGQITFAILQFSLTDALVNRSTVGRLELLSPVHFNLTSFLVGLVRSRSLVPLAELPRELAYIAALALLGTVALAVAAFAAGLAARRFSRGLLPSSLGTRTTRIVVVAFVIYQGVLWGTWLPHRAHTLPEMGRDLNARIPPTATVSPAGVYSLENSLRYDSRALREGRMFDAMGEASHYIVLAEHPRIGILPEGKIEELYPGSCRLAIYQLTGDYVYHLYSAPPRQPETDGERSALYTGM